MPITTITTPPSRTAGLTQDAYCTAMESTLNTMKLAVDDINANASQYNVATSTTSTSNVLIGTGSKTFTVTAGLGFVVGMTLRIANTSTNYMTGDVTSYSSTTLIVNVTSVVGSGTFASWNISMAAVGANNASGISNTPAGNISATTVQAAINELDTEKLSSAAGAVTDTNLNSIITAGTIGDLGNIPVVTYTAKGRISSVTSAPKVTNGTAINTTSGTIHEFTGIPSTVKKIRVMFSAVSTSGSSNLLVQLGSTTYTTTGYSGGASSGAATVSNSAGFIVNNNVAATSQTSGHIEVSLLGSNTYTQSGGLCSGGGNAACVSGGAVTLSGVLDRIRLTTANGTDTFDAGTINVAWE